MAAGHTVVVLKTHRTIAALIAHDSGSRAQALDHVRQCLTLAAAARQPFDEATCSWLEAELLRETDPVRAHAAERRALDATARANSRLAEASSASRHMQFSWETKPRDLAIRDSLAAIDTLETLRSLQDDGESSAELFSTWTLDYYWFSGRLLRDLKDGDLELAFSITERLRARSLLDRLDRSRKRLDPSNPLVANRRSLLEAIAKVQRGLMDPATKDDERRTTLRAARRAGAAGGGSAAPDRRGGSRQPSVRARAFASLDAVQSALADNEALLSFQVGIWETYEGEFGGGSWLIALTRHGRAGCTAFPIARSWRRLCRSSRACWREATRRNRGRGSPVRRHSRGCREGASRRNRAAHSRARWAAASASVRRAAAGTRRARAGRRYEFEIAPSATLWLQWRRNAPRPGTKRALAFADPELAANSDQPRDRTQRRPAEGLAPGPPAVCAA